VIKALALLLLVTPQWLHAILPLPYPTASPQKEVSPLVTQGIDPRDVAIYQELYKGGRLREMELPSFNNTSATLGYKEGKTFTVPKELRHRVEFWKKIYSEYTSTQAVLHDDTHLEIIYGAIDISRFVSDERLSERSKRRKIRRVLKKEKKKIAEKLRTLHKLSQTPLKIPLELFPLFKKFRNIPGKDRYQEASERILGTE